MSHSDSRTKFTADEMLEIIQLISKKEAVDESTQKGIRTKLRKMGLYWSDLVPRKMPYTVANLKKLFENGTLQIIDADVDEVFNNVNAISQHANIYNGSNTPRPKSGSRENSDEHYVINLCDQILGMEAQRQHKFPFLRGDAGTYLPVDAYYEDLKLVVEYHESQHTQSTPLFDKRQTVSGVSRGEQRRMYDQRRRDILPQHGIKLIVISYDEFGNTKKLRRNKECDIEIIKKIFKENGIDPSVCKSE